MEDGFDRETIEELSKKLESGEVLTFLIDKLMKEPEQEMMLTALWCLRDSEVWLPVVSDSPDIVPDTLVGESGAKYFPVFSRPEEMPKEYSEIMKTVKIAFTDCMKMFNSDLSLEGILVNAFTSKLFLDKEMVTKMGELPTEMDDSFGDS